MRSEIVKLAKAYLVMHPMTSEHSVKIPGGRTIYPRNENNALSDRIRWIKENYQGYIDKMLQTPYAKHSLILSIAKQLQDAEIDDNMEFVLNLFVGMKDDVDGGDSDYFKITPMEDTISKMMMINGRYNPDTKSFDSFGSFVLPTMADKKTFYAI